MPTMTHCIQCKDMTTGRIGTFIYSNDKPFYAVSPVCKDLVELYAWMKVNRWKTSGNVADMRVYKFETPQSFL